MPSEKILKESNRSDRRNSGKKLKQIKAVYKNRTIKSGTTKHQAETPNNVLKAGKSEQVNGSKHTKSCTIPKFPTVTRAEYVSPYKMSVLQHNSSTKTIDSISSKKPEPPTKPTKTKPVKKHRKKPSCKKSKFKVDETEFHDKLYCVQNRICILIVEIKRGLFDQIIMPDGREDLAKRKKCEHEFWCRFSRNFNSELGRQLRVLQRLLHAKPRTSSIVIIIQRRVLAIHQIVFQALSSYLSHMPMSLNNDFNPNVKSLGEVFIEALKVCTDHKLCTHVPKIQYAMSTLLNFTEEDKRVMMSNYREMKPLNAENGRRKEHHAMIKRLSMYLDGPGQYRLRSKSLRRSTKSRSAKKSAVRTGPDPDGPIIVDPDVETWMSVKGKHNIHNFGFEEQQDDCLQQALYYMGNLISNAIQYKNALNQLMSTYSRYYGMGKRQFRIARILAVQLLNEMIIDMTTWSDEKIKAYFGPRECCLNQRYYCGSRCCLFERRKYIYNRKR